MRDDISGLPGRSSVGAYHDPGEERAASFGQNRLALLFGDYLINLVGAGDREATDR